MKKTQKDEFLSSRVRYIPINTVRPNPQQPRRSFDETALRELADSIRAYGILQPLTVRDRGGFYELVAGERRLRAARIAGLREVPCLVAEVGEEDAALLALIENLQRRDLDYMEEAADKLGKSQPAIANKLRLLRLAPPVIDCLRQYGLTERHARTLLRLTDPEQQLAAARHMGQRGLNVAQAEQYIDALAARNRTEPLRRRPTYIIKDVRLFLNSVERGVRLMQSAGVGAEVGRCDTDEEILLTIHIPKRRPAGVVTDS